MGAPMRHEFLDNVFQIFIYIGTPLHTLKFEAIFSDLTLRTLPQEQLNCIPISAFRSKSVIIHPKTIEAGKTTNNQTAVNTKALARHKYKGEKQRNTNGLLASAKLNMKSTLR